MLPCTVCGHDSEPLGRHPDVDLYRCGRCDHCFTDVSTLEQVAHYTTDYGDVEHQNWFEHPNTALFDFIADTLAEAGARSVLDLGCGRGALLAHLRGRDDTLSLTGVELTPFDPPEGTTVVCGDLFDVDAGGPFDAVVSLAVIEHVPDPHAFIHRMRQLSRPGGLIIVMTLNDRSILYATSRLLDRAGFSGPFVQLYEEHHLNHFNKRSLEELLVVNGLHVDERLDHNIPRAAIDVRGSGPVAAEVQRLGAQATFLAGQMTGRCYLQTVVVQIPVEP